MVEVSVGILVTIAVATFFFLVERLTQTLKGISNTLNSIEQSVSSDLGQIHQDVQKLDTQLGEMNNTLNRVEARSDGGIGRNSRQAKEKDEAGSSTSSHPAEDQNERQENEAGDENGGTLEVERKVQNDQEHEYKISASYDEAEWYDFMITVPEETSSSQRDRVLHEIKSQLRNLNIVEENRYAVDKNADKQIRVRVFGDVNPEDFADLLADLIRGMPDTV